MNHYHDEASTWPLWRKLLFRFLFIYLFFTIAPWSWFDIPDTTFFSKWVSYLIDPIIGFFNRTLFHIRPVLILPNGSGDTSYGWAAVWTYVTLSVLGCIIWTVFDQKRQNYERLNYWLCLFVRYFIALAGFFYGYSKVFLVQMPFPSLHQLATPLGDFSPMRFAWMFIGYSGPYQVFSGVLELFVGLLLLNRRTVTLGLVLGTCVFANVMMLNLSYDIVVKIYSMHLVFCCLFLLINENNRLFKLLVLNQSIEPTALYQFNYHQKWLRISRVALKTVFILFAVGFVFYVHTDYLKQLKQMDAAHDPIFKNGIYRVTAFTAGNQPLADSLRWEEMIFDKGQGSMRTADTTFAHRYKRAYFRLKTDTVKHTVVFQRKMPDGSLKSMVNFRYTLPDTNTILLAGVRGKDSLFVSLKRTNRNFALAKWQFNWLLEGPQ